MKNQITKCMLGVIVKGLNDALNDKKGHFYVTQVQNGWELHQVRNPHGSECFIVLIAKTKTELYNQVRAIIGGIRLANNMHY